MRIAEYELYKRSPAESVPPKISESYSDAIRQLELLAKGGIEIAQASASNSAGLSVAVSSRTDIFDSSSMGGF